MEQFTYSYIKQKLQNDYDITDENWVSETELLDYINEAIDDAETAIHTMHHEKKYFLVPTTITLVSGTQDYALPSDIYATKIRLLQYINGTKRYLITPIKKLESVAYIDSGSDYSYIIINVTGTGFRLRLYPTPNENGAYITLWYVRNMARLTTSTASTNICEIPECGNFVIQHVKKNLAKKSRRRDLVSQEDADLKLQYAIMLEALKDPTYDEDNTAEIDTFHYEQQSGIVYG